MLVYNRIKDLSSDDNLVSSQSSLKPIKTKQKLKPLLKENKLFLKSIGFNLKKQ